MSRQPWNCGRVVALFLLGSLLIGVLPSLAQGTTTADVPPYSLPGPYSVGFRSFVLNDDPMPRTGAIWYPGLAIAGEEAAVSYDFGASEIMPPEANFLEGHAFLNADPFLDDGPYPLIVVSHGAVYPYYVLAYVFEELASQGFVVYAFDHSHDAFRDMFSMAQQGERAMQLRVLDSIVMRPVDVTEALDYVAALTAPDGDLAGLVDMERVGMVGMSYGGYTVLAELGLRLDLSAIETACTAAQSMGPYTEMLCNLHGDDVTEWEAAMADLAGVELTDSLWPSLADPRIDVGVAIVPGGPLAVLPDDSFVSIDKPFMMLVGGADPMAVPELGAERAWDLAASETVAMATFDGAMHMFSTHCPAAWQECVDPAWDGAVANALTSHFTTAFLRSTLLDDAEAAAALTPEAVEFENILYQARGL